MNTPSLFKESYKPINFTRNWNNKLNNVFLTTIRLWQNQYTVNEMRIVRLNDTEIKLVRIVELKEVLLDHLEPHVTLTDAGLRPIPFKEMMAKMYKNKVTSVDTVPFVIVTLQTCEVYSIAPNYHG